ncbi:nucleotidyltransferase family protein [Candidatus Aalborgicola defluviihabitans]|uniref:nucleotidyltransferase family protein n=1 Tax=Candidatus Aalborgicola defluviihabitans TaxID=3386187 RepID=UPI0039B89386
MRPSESLTLHRTQIREIALRHRVSDVRVFGSALHGDDTAESDLDLLVEPTAQTTLMDIGAIRFELKQLLGMDVDVLTPNGLPASFRDQVCARPWQYESRRPAAPCRLIAAHPGSHRQHSSLYRMF